MKKSNFVAMIMSVLGILSFGIGMSMCLIPEWNTFNIGVGLGIIGIIILLVTIVVWRKMENKEPINLNKKLIITILLSIISFLILGYGMSLVMVWKKIIEGIVVGVAGIFMLLLLIGYVKEIK